MQKSKNKYLGIIKKYIENQLKLMDLYIKHIKMNGKWLGCIQPMCSAPGHSWQGRCFSSSRSLFVKSALFGVCIIKPPFFIIKRPDPGKKILKSTKRNLENFRDMLFRTRKKHLSGCLPTVVRFGSKTNLQFHHDVERMPPNHQEVDDGSVYRAGKRAL